MLLTTRSANARFWRGALVALIVASPLSAQTTYGGELIERGRTDTYTNWVAIAATPFDPLNIGASLLSVSAWGQNNGQIAPMLVRMDGGSWNVVAVGATRSVSRGLNSWGFDAVWGSAVITDADVRFAWWNSGGAVGFGFGGDEVHYTSNLSYGSPPAAPATLVLQGSQRRTYSLQWTVSGSQPDPDPDPDPDPNPVPEPSMVGLLAVGMLALLARRQRA